MMMPVQELLENALYLLTTESIYVDNGKCGSYFGGQKAYFAWADAMPDDKNFSKDVQLSLLIEHMMCFGDAATMVGEGRSYAAGYINWLGDVNSEISKECKECAEYLKAAADIVAKMQNFLGGFGGEEAARKLANKEIRIQIVSLIKEARQEAQQNEGKACEVLKVIITRM